jgi:sulfate transport system permease protein
MTSPSSTIIRAPHSVKDTKSWRKHSVIPGFGLTLSLTLFYLTLIVLIPLAGLFLTTVDMSLSHFWETISDPRVVHAYKISFGISFAAGIINAIGGLIVAWVLVRYPFPGKKLVDACIDLPFAMPTAVSGIALAALYSRKGVIGEFLYNIFGIEVAFTPLGIAVALVFIGLPFVVRTVEPVLEDMDKEIEEAAASLGATRCQTFYKVVFPQISPALLTGFAMAFARALGEYGSVIFIAGNMPYVSEIVPLVIIIKLEQYDYAGATAIALVMLSASFLMLFVINWLQKWSRQKREG